MKLEKILIEDFRGIDRLELDFTDELDRVLSQVPIVGPNTSGKTTILDAISLCLGPTTELHPMRSDLVIHPSSLVRRGAVRAHVRCAVRFSDKEIAEVSDVLSRVGHKDAGALPKANQIVVDWNYPDPEGKHRLGLTRWDTPGAYNLFKGRKIAAKSFHVPGVSAQRLLHLGGVFMFDQRRTGLSQRITPEMRAFASRGDDGEEEEETPGERSDPEFTKDPRAILTHFASRAEARRGPESTARDDYERLQTLFARVCNPHRIKGLCDTKSGLDIEFEGPKGAYFFDGLSSGQTMLLLLLLRFARLRIHSSIVLIDELELHLHPLWQTRLYQSLGALGTDNQIFFTTHSTHLRDLLRGEVFHTTGELGDRAAEKEEA